MATAYIGLGSNLAAPLEQLARARAALAALPGTRVRAVSSYYRTAPVGYEEQPDFINAVAALETDLAPHALLDALLAIECQQGRVRALPNGPRTLDLDLLDYDGRASAEAGLILPHPRMHLRAFVMVPLAEIAPQLVIAGHGTTVELARALAQSQRVERVATV